MLRRMDAPIPLAAVSSADDEHDADDATLVAHALADRRAFAPLYTHYLDPIYRYCYRRLDTREAAEDATSQIFTKALAALPAYRGDGFRGWLFAIARNVVMDAYRRPCSTLPLDSVSEPVDRSPSPESLAVTTDERAALRALLAALPEDQRSVIELRLAGLTGAEIAVALGRGTGAIKMLQFRAMTRLRGLLNDERRPDHGTA